MIALAVAAPLAQALGPVRFGAVLDSFADDVARLVEEMDRAIQRGDAVAVRHAAHGLAGAAASLGAVSVESLARLGLAPGPYPGGLITDIRRAAVEAMDALNSLRASLDPPGEPGRP